MQIECITTYIFNNPNYLGKKKQCCNKFHSNIQFVSFIKDFLNFNYILRNWLEILA
jgi:hypothetical protein